ncbi:MAG: triose-phosphate isomerase [Candidatus Coatesbacteria bacterium]
MSRQRIAAANWKMYKTRSQAKTFMDAFAKTGPWTGAAKVVVCPPFTSLDVVGAGLGASGVALGAQDCHWETEGAFTGEVATAMLKDAGCTYVIVGHSERRKLFGETDETVNKKLQAAVKAGLIPILCVGETLQERDAGKTESVVRTQVTGGLAGFDAATVKGFVIAYEPVWAIGTGKVATPQQAQEVHAVIRKLLADRGPEVAAAVPVLYGGSVKADNIAALMAGPDLDGGLVGGAALDPVSFAAIAKGIQEAQR